MTENEGFLDTNHISQVVDSSSDPLGMVLVALVFLLSIRKDAIGTERNEKECMMNMPILPAFGLVAHGVLGIRKIAENTF